MKTLRQIAEEISKNPQSDYQKLIKLLQAASKIAEKNIDNAHNIDLTDMSDTLDDWCDELRENGKFEIYPEEELNEKTGDWNPNNNYTPQVNRGGGKNPEADAKVRSLIQKFTSTLGITAEEAVLLIRASLDRLGY